MRSRPQVGSRTSRSAKAATIVVALAALAASCGADDPQDGVAQLIDAETTVVVANSPGTLTNNGQQRVLVGLIGDGPNQFVGGPDEPAVVELAAVDGDGSGEVSATWLSSPGVALGVYVAPFTFSEPGLWQVSIKGADESVAAALVEIAEESVVPEAGQPAPPSVTPTGSSAAELEAISTDPDPEPTFYDLTVAEAVGNGRPTVVVFATPAFCRTAVCGPTVEIAKDAAAGRDDVDFVHVEPFDVAEARAGTLNPIDAMFEWGLATEPWVFVVDREGLVSASFEGIIGENELGDAIDEL
jgi:hypothetical protein